MSRTALLLFQLGGPETPDEVEEFLYNLFRDPFIIALPWGTAGQERLARFISSKRAPKMRPVYEHIGGSPIARVTNAQAKRLESVLAARGVLDGNAKACVVMRYTRPFAREAIEAACEAGCDRFVFVPLYPHYARATTGSSFWDARETMKSLGLGDAQVAVVKDFPTAPRYVEAMVDVLKNKLEKMPPDAQREAIVIFSAHSLPISYILAGDPYQQQIVASAHAIAQAASLPWARCEVMYQSQTGPVPWLGPATPKMFKVLAAMGKRDVVGVPISFVGEHVETLHEMDGLFGDAAKAAGVRWYRVAALDDHPLLAEALADEVEAAIARPWIAAEEIEP